MSLREVALSSKISQNLDRNKIDTSAKLLDLTL